MPYVDKLSWISKTNTIIEIGNNYIQETIAMMIKDDEKLLL